MSLRAVPLPDSALLQRYAKRSDCYSDCFEMSHVAPVRLHVFVEAFYSTPLFRVERFILWLAGYPSNDYEIAGLTEPGAPFAAWTVEDIALDQILMCDVSGRTRSWLAVGEGKLMFGSAVVPRKPGQGLGPVFSALLPLHRFYSRALLWSAARRLP